MCYNCGRDSKQISASMGWCELCMKAYKKGFDDGRAEGWSNGFGEAQAEGAEN